jgi:hypothetical protein
MNNMSVINPNDEPVADDRLLEKANEITVEIWEGSAIYRMGGKSIWVEDLPNGVYKLYLQAGTNL